MSERGGRPVKVVALALMVAGWSVAQEPPPQVGPQEIGPPAARIRLKAAPSRSVDDLVDACVTTAMAAHDTPGVAVAVVDGGVMVVERGYGVKRRGQTDPVNATTYFRIGSVTKQLTAAAVMQQVETGVVDLADPVTRWVPELSLTGPWPAERITVHHLLTHSSGYPDNFVAVNGPTSDAALGNWAAVQDGAQLHAPPGEFWNYSNPNFALAGLVAERAAGIPYRQYMATRVFAPAGLERTTFDPAAVIADGDWSYGHYRAGLGLESAFRPDSYDHGAFAPAGYAFSTAGDLARWALLLVDGGGAVLSPTSAALMQEPLVAIEVLPYDWYGYGIFHEHYDGLELRQHGGNIPGWGTYLLWIPERRAAVAVLANTFESLADAAYCIVDEVFGTPGAEPLDLSSNPELWPRFVGRYPGRDSIGSALDAVVTLVDGDLAVDLVNPDNPLDHLAAPLVPAFWNTFVIDYEGDGVYDLDLTFHLGEGTPGRVEWLVNRSWVGARAVPPRPPAGRVE